MAGVGVEPRVWAKARAGRAGKGAAPSTCGNGDGHASHVAWQHKAINADRGPSLCDTGMSFTIAAILIGFDPLRLKRETRAVG
jgi:hypothetical protein